MARKTASGAPGIAAQITAVEMMLVNQRQGCAVLKGLVDRHKRPASELAMKEMYLPALEQAVQSLRFVEKNADDFRAFMKSKPKRGASGDAAQSPPPEKLA